MGTSRYTEEFKAEAVVQVIERGYTVKEVSERIGVSTNSLYHWMKKDPRKLGSPASEDKQRDLEAEVTRLKSELRRVQEERDILKKSRGVLCKAVRLRYAFIKEHRRRVSDHFDVQGFAYTS